MNTTMNKYLTEATADSELFWHIVEDIFNSAPGYNVRKQGDNNVMVSGNKVKFDMELKGNKIIITGK